MYRNLNPSALGISGRQSEAIELALSHSFKGLDLDFNEFQQTVKSHGLAHARRLIDSARLKIGTFRLPLVWDDDDEQYKSALTELAELAPMAANLGLTRALTLVAPANDLRPYPDNFEIHRRRLNEIGVALAPQGMKLGLEFSANAALRKNRAFQFIHTFEALLTLIGMIRSTNVGVVADLFEMHLVGSGLDELRKLGGERIVSVIVSDAPVDKPASQCTGDDRLMPGETGAIDLAATLSTLAEIGYDGPVTPAASAESLRGMKRDQIVKLAAERLAQAWVSPGAASPGASSPGKLTPVHH